MGASMLVKDAGFEIADFDQIIPELCPCGPSRRAFVDRDGTMSLHRVEIVDEDKPHRHQTDELYIILKCGDSAAMMLNHRRYPVRPGMAIKIRGGTWHCADRGGEPMTVLVVVATGHGSPESVMQIL